MSEMPTVRRWDYVIALVLFLGSSAILGLAQRDQGVMRDEGTYFEAAERYWGWFEQIGDTWGKDKGKQALTAKAITRHFGFNSEHPALFKLFFGLSWRFLHQRNANATKAGPRHVNATNSLGLLDEISAFRLPTWLFTGFGVMLVFLFGVRIEGRIAGLTAALAYLTMPRLFFHGQLACFDAGIATLWLLVVYAYFRALSRARWGIVAGIAFGLALAGKHNAWFIPALLLIHYLIVVWPDLSLRPLRPPRMALPFVSMAVLGPAIFVGHWPWLWFDTVGHIERYFRFHLSHSFYNMEWLGVNYGPPPLPIAYPFGMTFFTVPTLTLLLACGGAWIYARPAVLGLVSRWIGVRPPPFDDRFRFPARRSWLRPGQGLNPRLGTLLLLNALFPIALIALPWTPIFGGTKHWLPALPFIALLAGVAVQRLVKALAPAPRLLRGPAVALVAVIALPGALSISLTHPFGLSQYNTVAGGVAGGADLGLNRQFWGYAPRQLLPWINETFPDKAKVYFHDVDYRAYRAYIRGGLLRPDIRYAGMELPAIRRSQRAMVVHELHFNKYDYWIWSTYGSPVPTKVLELDNVPLVSVYSRSSPRERRPGPARPDAAPAKKATKRKGAAKRPRRRRKGAKK